MLANINIISIIVTIAIILMKMIMIITIIVVITLVITLVIITIGICDNFEKRDKNPSSEDLVGYQHLAS